LIFEHNFFYTLLKEPSFLRNNVSALNRTVRDKEDAFGNSTYTSPNRLIWLTVIFESRPRLKSMLSFGSRVVLYRGLIRYMTVR